MCPSHPTNMKLLLKRLEFFDTSTRGELFIDGNFFCYTEEDKDRGLSKDMELSYIQSMKVTGETCIPYGTYKIEITPSARFKRLLPLLIDVPAFQGIRVHPGNTDKDTEGCILVGRQKDPHGLGILQSKLVFDELFPLLHNITDIYIEITR